MSNLKIGWLKLDAVPQGLREIPAAQVLRRPDAAITFHGAWKSVLSEAINAHVAQAVNIGDEVVMAVVGDRVALNLTRHPQSAKIEIYIDGGHPQTMDVCEIWRDWTPTVLMMTGLGAGAHSIRIRISGKGHLNHASQIWLRSFFVPEDVVPLVLPETTGSNGPDPQWKPLSNCLNLLSCRDKNVGDQRSSPVHYFDFLRDTPQADMFGWHPQTNPPIKARMNFYNALEDKNIVIGGGGLLATEYFRPALDFIRYGARRKVVLWGVGHNSHHRLHWSREFNAYDFSVVNFELVGVRDWGTRFRWVPCASCMAPQFDAEIPIKRQVGFFLHAVVEETKKRIMRENAGAEMLDNFSDFEKAINFIGESETVVTNSFHGVYWATLLKRRVIGLPTASKFFSLKHPVPLTEIGDWRSALDKTFIYEDALEECRSRNRDFARDVYQALA